MRVEKMNEIVSTDSLSPELFDQVRTFFDKNGLTQAIGGTEMLEQGFKELAAGILPVISELVVAQTGQVALADAVFDTERFPHLVRVHGFLNDVLVMDIPRDLLPSAKKIVLGDLPKESQHLRKAAASQALQGQDSWVYLARFALFEALCLNQRLILLAEKGHIESFNGRSSDIETIAEREVELAVEWEKYGKDLISVDDPLKALVAAAAVALSEHIHNLREELLVLKNDVHESLDRRRRILEVMDALPADQAALVYNECASEFGEEKLEAELLKKHHPGFFGHIGRDAIYQRVHRLPDRIKDLENAPEKVRRTPSLADLILNKTSE